MGTGARRVPPTPSSPVSSRDRGRPTTAPARRFVRSALRPEWAPGAGSRVGRPRGFQEAPGSLRSAPRFARFSPSSSVLPSRSLRLLSIFLLLHKLIPARPLRATRSGPGNGAGPEHGWAVSPGCGRRVGCGWKSPGPEAGTGTKRRRRGSPGLGRELRAAAHAPALSGIPSPREGVPWGHSARRPCLPSLASRAEAAGDRTRHCPATGGHAGWFLRRR